MSPNGCGEIFALLGTSHRYAYAERIGEGGKAFHKFYKGKGSLKLAIIEIQPCE